jgi:Cu2+-exporting ATPase
MNKDTTKNKPNTKPVEAQVQPVGSGRHDHHDYHAHMAADFQKRFWISLVLTLPILALSPMLQKLLGLREAIHFSGDLYVLFGFASAVFWYGGWPFLKGLFRELKFRQPGMMTLIAVAITTAYLYSSAVVFGLTGKMFFWELATLASPGRGADGREHSDCGYQCADAENKTLIISSIGTLSGLPGSRLIPV